MSLYIHVVINGNEIFSINDDYNYLREHENDIEKDDYDISI